MVSEQEIEVRIDGINASEANSGEGQAWWERRRSNGEFGILIRGEVKATITNCKISEWMGWHRVEELR